MRILMLFSIGFAAACSLAVWLLPSFLLVVFGAISLFLGVLMLFVKNNSWIPVVAVLLLGFGSGQILYGIYDEVQLSPLRELDGQTVLVSFVAEDFSYDTTYGIGVDGKLRISGKTYRCRMYLNQTDPVEPGDRVIGDFRLRYTAPGGLEDATYHSGNGILLLAYPKDESIALDGSPAWYHAPALLRQKVMDLISNSFPTDVAPFARALLLGDTSQLSYKTESNLSISGLRHIAAVSGLHVSILFSVVYVFAGRRKWLTVLIGIPVLIVFMAMAGFSPSIMRAGIMQMLMLLALAISKEYDPPTALAFAVLTMLVCNPLTITSVAFQLSVASVTGIFLFSRRINGWILDAKRLGKFTLHPFLGKTVHTIAGSISVSVSALLTTTPLTAIYFGSVSLMSVLTNLLCLWAVTLLFCGIIAVCVLAAIWLPLGQAMGWLFAWIARYILGVAHLSGEMPLAAVYTSSPYIVAWLVFCYLLLIVFLLMKQKCSLLMICCAALGLFLSVLVSWMEPRLDDYRVTVLDVGQGQCVLLQSDGKTYMVDCGSDDNEAAADTAVAFLHCQGIFHLDGIILTHYDKDHVGGVQYLLQRMETDVLILPQEIGRDAWDDLILANYNGSVVRLQDDLQISWRNAQITVFSSWTNKSGNESSACVLFHTEKCDILITGDRSITGEKFLLQMENIPKLDALVVGHHGAASSTGEALLQQTQPDTALISVGADNPYGHPAAEVLQRLTQYGCQIRRTDLEGTIIIRG